MDWLRAILPNLLGWSEMKLPTCAEYDIPGALILMVYFPKATEIEARISAHGYEEFLKARRQGKLLTIEVADRSLEAVIHRSCLINYGFCGIPLCVHRKKQRKVLRRTYRVESLLRYPEES